MSTDACNQKFHWIPYVTENSTFYAQGDRIRIFVTIIQGHNFVMEMQNAVNIPARTLQDCLFRLIPVRSAF